MLPGDFLIRNVEVWNPDQTHRSVDVFVASGSVEAIEPSGSRPAPGVVFEGHGHALVPSGVDLQVHIRTPGQAHKETPMTAARAALRGGYGLMLAMPNTFPAVDSVEVLRRCFEEYAAAEKSTGVCFLQSAAVSRGLCGLEEVDFAALAQAGAAAFTDDGLPVVNDELMRSAFRASEKTGKIILQHAEWPGHGGVLADGRVQQELGVTPYPRDAEARCVERDLRLLREFPKARYHVLHATTKKTLELVQQAKREGFAVTCEVSPHHLYFCNEDIPKEDTNFKMNPPLFWAEDRAALIEGLKSGLVDFVATDHAPHELYGKSKGFQKAPFGTTGLETAFRVLLELLRRGDLESPEHLVRVFSTAPARQMGLAAEEGWGRVQAGAPLRAALWDVQALAQPVVLAELESLSKNNIFLGTALPGRVLAHWTPAGLFRFGSL